MSDEPKLKKKLRAAEAERVRLSRELDAARRDLINGVGLLREAEKEIKKLKKEAAAMLDAATTTEAGWMKAVHELNKQITAASDECEARKTVDNFAAMEAVIAVLKGGA